MAESRSGFLLKFSVYWGKDKTEVSGKGLLGYDIVTGFIRDMTPATVFTDNWYTSPKLFRKLKSNGVDAIGTVRMNRGVAEIMGGNFADGEIKSWV
jgi:hypothetical protein